MPFPESTDLQLEVFGGYNCSIPPAQLPPGSSPYCQDVMFPEAVVRQRDGLASTQVSPDAEAIFGLAQYFTPTEQAIEIVWTAAGNLYQGASLTLIASGGTPNLGFSSTTLFGRQYMAFGNGVSGIDFPRQFDGTNYDRVTQCGPGLITVSDNTVAQDLIELEQFTFTPQNLVQSGNICTLFLSNTASDLPLLSGATLSDVWAAGDQITLSGFTPAAYNATFLVTGVVQVSADLVGLQFFAPAGLGAASVVGTVATGYTSVEASFNIPVGAVGQTMTINGTTPTGYEGAWTIRYTNPTVATAFCCVYVNQTGLATATGSNAGTATPVGRISAGLHQVAVAFLTRQGWYTKPCPPASWNAAGGLQANAVIPVGPANVIGRLVMITPEIAVPATTGNFWAALAASVYTNAMLIQDNTTTFVTLDVADETLPTLFDAQYLFNQIELGSTYGAASYSSRLVEIGETASIQNLVNREFNGGWATGGTGGSVYPLGWTSDPTNGAGGSAAFNGGIWLDAYVITGDGINANRGMITQTAYQDWLSQPIFSLGTAYSVRVRAKTSGASSAFLTVELFSPSLGSIGKANFPLSGANSFGANYSELTLPIDTGSPQAPSDMLLRVYTSNTLPGGTTVTIDSIEPFQTSIPINGSLARVSRTNNAESFDGVTGQIQVRPNDGQQIRAVFTIRGNIYLAKERYLASAANDNTNEPSFWQVNEVSSSVGICGPNAVDTGEEWAAFANQSGLYVFWGAEPVKISQEIQEDGEGLGRPSWNDINWAAASTIWVRIDTVNKRILCGAPMGTAVFPNFVWAIDYKFSYGGEGLEAATGAQYGAFQPSVLLEHGGGRKWSPWNISAASCAIVQKNNVQTTLFGSSGLVGSLGCPATNGLIWTLTEGHYQDDLPNGTAINSVYETFGSPSQQQEQMLQLRSERKLFDYLVGRAIGSGTLALNLIGANRTTAIRGVTLSGPSLNTPDFERNLNVTTSRGYFQLGTNTVGQWWQLERLVPLLKTSPTVPVAGNN